MAENKANAADQTNDTESKASTRRQNSVWPLRDIKEPHENDVLYGRGGGTNHHSGNKRYRKMVEDRKLDYVNSKRLDKPLIACEIIREWRAQDPTGRFLKQSETTGLWFDVGDRKAREKTSQALREKAPLIRKQQEQQMKGTGVKLDDKNKGIGGNESDYHPSSEDDIPIPHNRNRVGFSDPPESEMSDPKLIKRSILMRDHSLGREYLKPDESVTIEGFSWDGPSGSGNLEKKKQNPSTSHLTVQFEGPAPEQGNNWNREHAPPSHYPEPNDAIIPAKPLKGREHSLAANPLTNVVTDVPIDPRFIGWDNPNPGHIFPLPLKNIHSHNNSPTAIERTSSGGSSSKFFPETNALYRSWSGGDGMMYPYGHESSFRSTSGQSDDYRRPSPYDPILQPQYSNNVRFPSATMDDNVVFSRSSSIQSEDFRQPTRANSFPPPPMQSGVPYNRPPDYPEPSLEREVSPNFPSGVFDNHENNMPPPSWVAPNQYFNHSPHDTPHSSFTDMPISPQPPGRPQRSTSRMSWEATMSLGRNKRSSSITAQQSQSKKVETACEDGDKPSTATLKPELRKEMSMGTFLNGVFDASNSNLPDTEAPQSGEKSNVKSSQKAPAKDGDTTQSYPESLPVTKKNDETSPSAKNIGINNSTPNETNNSASKDEKKDETVDTHYSKPLVLSDRYSSIGTFVPNDENFLDVPLQDKASQSGQTIVVSDHEEITSVEPTVEPPLSDWLNQSNTKPIAYDSNPLVSKNINDMASAEPSNTENIPDNIDYIASVKRPNPIKRATSNQNEDVFTKRDLKLTKRLLISRDESKSSDADENSLSTDNQFNNLGTDNQLIAQKDDEDIKRLSLSMGSSKLVDSSNKPSLLKGTDRVSTMDIIAADMKSWIDNI